MKNKKIFAAYAVYFAVMIAGTVMAALGVEFSRTIPRIIGNAVCCSAAITLGRYVERYEKENGNEND